MGSEELDELIVCKPACLWEAVHAASYFNVDMSIVDKGAQIVLVDDDVGNHIDGDTHVLVSFHGRSEIKILQVSCEELGIFGGEYTVYEQFGGSELGGLGADVEGVVNFVATACPANASRIVFFGSECGYNAQVRSFLSVWYGGDWYEMHRVGDVDGTVTLGEAADLISIGCLSEGAVAGLAEFAVFCDLASVWIEGVAV